MPLAVPFALLLLAAPQPATCGDAAGCRQAALEAAARKDFETFHDLAWRAVQQGRPNDPESMLLLARAQSLSGRPGDALVMLRRLAERGIALDVADDEDFRRVRALQGWEEVEALMAGARDRSGPALSPAAPEATKPPPATAPPGAPKAGRRETPAAERTAAPAAAPPAAPGRLAPNAADAVPLPGAGTELVGLAYDRASRRFVVADRRASKLIVADEVFKRVNDLIGAGAGGFGELHAVEIDERRGDLWVTSTEAGGAATVHKLQLVSGRVLFSVAVPQDLQPASLEDIAVTGDGTLLLLDSARSRILTLPPGSRTPQQGFAHNLSAVSSLAADGDRVFIAHAAGLSMANRRTRHVAAVRAAPDVRLTGLRKIRWHRGSLIAIQELGDSTGAQLVRIGLSRAGTSASSIEVLDRATPGAHAAMTLVGDDAYYVTSGESGPVIRRVPLRP